MAKAPNFIKRLAIVVPNVRVYCLHSRKCVRILKNHPVALWDIKEFPNNSPVV